MLAAQLCDSEIRKWPFGKTPPALFKLLRPLMSDPYEGQTPAKSIWSEEDIYIPPHEEGNPSQLFQPQYGSRSGQPQIATPTDEEKRNPYRHQEPYSEHYRNFDHRQRYDPGINPQPARSLMSASSSTGEQTGYRDYHAPEPLFRDRQAPGVTFGAAGEHSLLSPMTSSGQPTQTPLSTSHAEDEELSDDGDVVDTDAEAPQEQTAAERLAARRKMKRFRLTHHQTRFLMSEFAKQPHPDAAHRERLSREIPGLSPRQVQVWFQNRRAKIKRLNADDRERMMQMRAVPDDFDNVQALHSPYGAAHAYDTSLASTTMPSHGQMYSQHGVRPLMVDVRRTEGEQNMQNTGLTPLFGGIGFGHSHTSSLLETGSMLSSPAQPLGSTDRYGYGARFDMISAGDSKTEAGVTGGPAAEGESGSRPGVRPLRPAGAPDISLKGRSGSLQPPIGPGMFWRPESNEGSSLHGAPRNVLNEEAEGQHLHATALRMEPSGGGMGMSTGFYGDDGRRQPHNPDITAIHQAQIRRSRAASATFPLDARNQYTDLSQPVELSIRTENLRAGEGQTASHPASAYTPTYPTTPFSASSMAYTTSAPMEPRDSISAYGFAGGNSAGSGLSTYAHSSQAAGGSTRSLFDSPASMGFEQADQNLRYGESGEVIGTVKREP